MYFYWLEMAWHWCIVEYLVANYLISSMDIIVYYKQYTRSAG